MKRTLIAGLASLVLAQGALGYINQGYVLNPDFNIDDPVFVNDSGAQFIVDNVFSPYRTYNTSSYTNKGRMEAIAGFRFDNFNAAASQTKPAGVVYNDSAGIINVGVTTSGFTLLSLSTGAKCLISATNVINRGQINAGREGFISIAGKDLDLRNGRLTLAAFENAGASSEDGFFDGFWGLDTDTFNPSASFGTVPSPPLYFITNRDYTWFRTVISGAGATPYVDITSPSPSNFIVNVVYLANDNPAMTLNAYEDVRNARDTVVEWTWLRTDPITGAVTNDYLYLFDRLGSISNSVLATNGLGPASTGFRPTFIPTNYSIVHGGPSFLLGTQLSPGSTSGLFANTNLSIEFTAYEASFIQVTSNPFEVAGRSFTNMPGRVDLVSTGTMNLTGARITGANTVVLKALNHYTNTGTSKIVTPFADLDLRTTNGFLTVSNLLAPVVPRLSGSVDLYSARWNTSAAGATNRYHVTVVDSHLAPSVSPLLQNLALRCSTNLVINDVLNVISNLVLDAPHVTIATNGPAMANSAGQLSLLTGQSFGPDSTPQLLTLTNFGSILSTNNPNPMYFNRLPKGQPLPYDALVNHGTVINGGSFIFANYFENDGLFYAINSVIDLTSQTAWLHDGVMFAPNSDINLRAASLVITNHFLQIGRALNLAATDSLDDGTLNFPVTNIFTQNRWTVGAGFNLLSRPANASLLGTTLSSSVPAFTEVNSTWAGADLGVSQDGFVNNAALGHLILDGGTNSSFVLSGASSNNAIYVDLLELANFAATLDGAGNLAALQIDPSLTIYYAQATINGASVAEFLNGKNGGRLRWVSSYAGFFSGTNVVYPNGNTYFLNAALVASCNLDSDNDGTVNCSDPSPVFVPSQYRFRTALTNTPARSVALAWQTVAGAANSIFSTTNLASPNWQLVTNFVSAGNGQASFLAPLGAGNRFYRLRIDAAQP